MEVGRDRYGYRVYTAVTVYTGVCGGYGLYGGYGVCGGYGLCGGHAVHGGGQRRVLGNQATRRGACAWSRLRGMRRRPAAGAGQVGDAAGRLRRGGVSEQVMEREEGGEG